MCNLKWELKKFPLNIWLFFLILLVMLLLNYFVATKKIQRNTAAITDDFQRGLDDVYSVVEGPITLEKMNWIISEHNRLSDIIQDGQFSTEKDEENTYTGYVFSDNALFEQVYQEAKYSFEYGTEAQRIASTAKENAEYYQNRSSKKLATYYLAMANAFQSRNIPGFYRTDGWMSYFEYEFSNLMVLLTIMIGLSTIFSLEWEFGTKSIIRVISGGTQKSRRDKLLFALLFVFLITTLFSIQDYLIFAGHYNFSGLNNPLYAVPEMRETPLNISLGVFILVNFFVKLFGMCAFAVHLLLVSAVVKCNLYAFSGRVICLMLHILLNAVESNLSVLPLFNCAHLCSKFEGFALGGFFVLRIFSRACIQFIIGCCCLLLLCVLDRDQTPYKGKDNRHDSAYQMAT